MLFQAFVQEVLLSSPDKLQPAAHQIQKLPTPYVPLFLSKNLSPSCLLPMPAVPVIDVCIFLI